MNIDLTNFAQRIKTLLIENSDKALFEIDNFSFKKKYRHPNPCLTQRI
jgi:hypothetical protein